MRNISKRSENKCQGEKSSPTFIAALFIIIQSENNPNVHQLMDKPLWPIHTMESYSAMKRNEVLIYATTWINLRDMLSESNQSEKILYYMISFIFSVQNRQRH